MTFTLAMVKNPRVWKSAQAEIDAVIGTDRLPELEDRLSLPCGGDHTGNGEVATGWSCRGASWNY